MKVALFLSGILFVMYGCSSNEKSKVIHTEVQKTISTPDIKANEILKMDIEGMVCQMGCGAAIRKELKATKAVCSVEFDFEEGRKSNTAKVAYNNQKITADKLVKIVETINDKQFKVSGISTEPFACDVKKDKKPSESECHKDCSLIEEEQEEDTSLEMATSEMEVPNFLHIITNIFVN